MEGLSGKSCSGANIKGYCIQYPAAVLAAKSAVALPLAVKKSDLEWPGTLITATCGGIITARDNLSIKEQCAIGEPLAV